MTDEPMEVEEVEEVEVTDDLLEPWPVKVILRSKGLVLVEWLDTDQTLHRSYVPADSIQVDETEQAWSNQAKIGPAFGVPWADMLDDYVLDVELLQATLRRYNIWEYSDLIANSQAVRAAILVTFQGLVDSLKSGANSYETGA